MRFVTSLAAAVLVASFAVHAQETTTKTKTTTKMDDAKRVSYTGCINAGTETKTFVLNKVVPVTTTKTTEVAGTGGSITTTQTNYFLVPDQTVQLQTYVGKKVEVSGVMIPEGEWKTKTKIEREGAKDTKIVAKGEADWPHFRVVSVKDLNEPCTP